jgi:hypothetical protein
LEGSKISAGNGTTKKTGMEAKKFKIGYKEVGNKVQKPLG